MIKSFGHVFEKLGQDSYRPLFSLRISGCEINKNQIFHKMTIYNGIMVCHFEGYRVQLLKDGGYLNVRFI